MYPKFGFERVKEYEYFKKKENNSDSQNFQKLDMSKQLNRDMLYTYAKHSAIFGKISMQENADLVMFYCISFLKEHVYYIKLLDVVVVATFDNNQLKLWDVFGKEDGKLNDVINSLATSQTEKILLGFTPNDCNTFTVREFVGDDALFIKKEKTNIFKENKLMFPLLSHA